MASWLRRESHYLPTSGERRRGQPASEERTPPQNTDDAKVAPVPRQGDDGQEPDVLLDVSELEVDRINLEVDNLRAHVSILAELANLLSLSVGVDARLDRVKLEIEGVEAKVLLKVRLKHVRAILEKALDTIAEHPEILRILARSLSRVVRESLEETLGTLNDVLEGLEVGDTVDEALRGGWKKFGLPSGRSCSARREESRERLRESWARVLPATQTRLPRACSLWLPRRSGVHTTRLWLTLDHK
jgi:hypothetical protein